MADYPRPSAHDIDKAYNKAILKLAILAGSMILFCAGSIYLIRKANSKEVKPKEEK